MITVYESRYNICASQTCKSFSHRPFEPWDACQHDRHTCCQEPAYNVHLSLMILMVAVLLNCSMSTRQLLTGFVKWSSLSICHAGKDGSEK
jgi:hypothetical protein